MEDQNPRDDYTGDHSSMNGNVDGERGAACYCGVCNVWLCDSRHWADHCAGKKHEISSRRQNVVSIDSSGASAQQPIELRDSEARSSNVNPGSDTHSEADLDEWIFVQAVHRSA